MTHHATIQTIQYNKRYKTMRCSKRYDINDTAQTTQLSACGDMSEAGGEINLRWSRNERLRRVERLLCSGRLLSLRDIEVTAELAEYLGNLAITLEGFSVSHGLVWLPARVLLAGLR